MTATAKRAFTKALTIYCRFLPKILRYILYTEKQIIANEPHFNIYSGYPTAQFLKDVKGDKIENYQITMNSLEAGEQAYSERKDIYETLKN